MILCIETATEVCSVVVCHNGKILALEEEKEGRSHASKLTPLIESAFKKASAKMSALDAVAVSMGPGSYTGLRIGVSVAKGISYALKKPLIAIGTLDAMCHGFIQSHASSYPGDALFCPMIDARRMEVFNSVYNHREEMIRNVEADIIDSTSFNDLLTEHPLVFFGNGAAKCKEMITSPNAIFYDNFVPSASFLAQLSEKALKDEKFEDVAYFEPYYLKDFIATVPKNQVLLKRKTGR
jgi:tRNA threonylcarbamoyladenosine biosynthesis protein TsaB